jgi:hypothetical protein
MALSDTLGLLKSLYPQARVTSGYRSPSSPLGRTNPRSYHNVGQAFDVAPIPGVGFNDYVNNLKSHGVNVVEALDEASHPAFDTTGPNWHIAFGGAQVAPQQKKKPTLASMAAPQADPQMQQPLGLDAQPLAQMQAPMSLGDLVQSPNLKAPSKFNLGNIAGVLGDALMAYGGMKPEFGPMLAQQQQDDKMYAYDREKLNAELQAQRDKALEPPSWLTDAATYQALPDAQKTAVNQFFDARNPVVADQQNADGSVVRRVYPRQVPPHPGTVDGGYVFMGGDPGNPANWRKQ